MKKHMLVTLLLVLSLCLPISICAAASYDNEKFGFAIEGPLGWPVTQKDNIMDMGDMGSMGVLVRFNKDSAHREPYLSVTLLPVRPQEETYTALDMAKDHIEETQGVKKNNFKLVEDPKVTSINGIEIAYTIYEITVNNGLTYRHLLYYIRKGDVFFQIVAVAKKDEFEGYLKDFDYSINTINLR